MPLFDETTLEKRATQVVDRFVREKIALTDGVVDAAQEENLNPEQVKRLVETVNNMTFLRQFQNAPDRLTASEFEPASADAALQRIIEMAGAENEPSAENTTGPSTAGGINNADDLIAALPETRPGAQALPPPEPQAPPPEARVSGAKIGMRLEKTAMQLRDEKYQAQYRFTDEFQKLATSFTRTDAPSFENFEQDALYKYGHAAVPHLGALRAALRKPAATYDPDIHTKVARIIDSRTPAMNSFHRLLEEADKMVKAAHAEQKVQEYQVRVRTTVR